MIEKGIRFHRFRLLLDCLLVIAVLLAIVANYQPDQAIAASQVQLQAVITGIAPEYRQEYQAPITSIETEVIRNSVTLDINTLAAMIAAENAALTLPQYMTDLPIITR